MGYISVIGSGSWGTTLAALLSSKGYDVTLWSHEKETADNINEKQLNPVYLPDRPLPAELKATTDIYSAVSKSRYIVNVVPTQHIRTVFGSIAHTIKDDSLIISASKGIEIKTLQTPSMILKEVLKKDAAVISGPSFAMEVSAKMPTAVTLAADDKKNALLMQELFNTDYFRVYTHDDVIGVEIGGALKNVIAIAAGICDGLNLGHNSRAALITRGLSEISRLGLSMGATDMTFSGLSGLGDLVLTCTAMMSRNYTVGYKLGRGMTLSEITGEMKSVAEGVATTLSAYELSKKHNIHLPITEQVYLTLYQDKHPAEAVKDLMRRSLKSEFYGY